MPTYRREKFEEAIKVAWNIYEHRRKNPTFRSVEVYYRMVAGHLERIKQAHEAGRPWIACGFGTPYELLVALDIPFAIQDVLAGVPTSLLRLHDEVYNAAGALGIRAEVCSAQRLPIGAAAFGLFPPPSAAVYTDVDMCGSVGGVGAVLSKLYDIPAFFFSYAFNLDSEEAIARRKAELLELASFLERVAGRKLDRDRLREVLFISKKQHDLIREINRLRMAIPCPLSNRVSNQAHWAVWLGAGREEGVEYFETLRDELKEMVEAGKGAAERERFRLLSLFTLPQNQHRFFDWAERELGAVFFEPGYWRWREWEPQMDDPLGSLARKQSCESYYRWYNSLEECLAMALEEAKEARVDAAVNFFNEKCNLGGAYSRAVKDALQEKLGIPTLVFGVDMIDPSPTLEAQLKERLAEFLQVVSRVR